MVKIRVYYDDNREIVEFIRLLSPRMNYCKTYPEEKPKRAYFGIATEDLLADLVNENDDEATELLDSGEDTPLSETEGGDIDVS